LKCKVAGRSGVVSFAFLQAIFAQRYMILPVSLLVVAFHPAGKGGSGFKSGPSPYLQRCARIQGNAPVGSGHPRGMLLEQTYAGFRPATSTMNSAATLMTSHVCWLRQQHPPKRGDLQQSCPKTNTVQHTHILC
jgi:hypothetical protein